MYPTCKYLGKTTSIQARLIVHIRLLGISKYYHCQPGSHRYRVHSDHKGCFDLSLRWKCLGDHHLQQRRSCFESLTESRKEITASDRGLPSACCRSSVYRCSSNMVGWPLVCMREMVFLDFEKSHGLWIRKVKGFTVRLLTLRSSICSD